MALMRPEWMPGVHPAALSMHAPVLAHNVKRIAYALQAAYRINKYTDCMHASLTIPGLEMLARKNGRAEVWT